MKTNKTKKRKETPKNCVCGKPAVVVETRGGKMITCPNPMNCLGNIRTRWNRHEATAIAEWNNLIAEHTHLRGSI